MSAPILELNKLAAGYGKKRVIHGVDLALEPGSIRLLLGHNGAGKTTLFRTVFGLQKATGGEVVFKGKTITNRSPGQNVSGGIAFVPQGHGVFRTLSVAENLELGAFVATSSRKIAEAREMVCELFPILKERQKQAAGTMSGGQQQMLAIGMALMHQPEVLILDEPTIGLAPKFVDRVIDGIGSINSRLGTSILISEQNIQASLPIASEVTIIKIGEVVYQGSPEPLHDHVNLMKYF